MKKINVIKKLVVLGMSITMLMGTVNSVFAYNEEDEIHTYAGSARMDCYIHMDDFSGGGSLETDEDCELYMEGYVSYNDIFWDREYYYSFSSGDGWGRSVSACRETPYLTLHTHVYYRADSEDGGTSTSLDLYE